MADLGNSTARGGPVLQEGEEATLPRADPSDAPPIHSVSKLPPDDPAADLAASVTQSSELALRRQDAARARGFAQVVVVLCSAGLVSQYFLGGALWLRITFGVALLGLGGVAGRTWWVARHPIDYAPPVARVFALADALDALTSDRPYRAAVGVAEAREVIESSDGHFDPAVLEAFASISDERIEEIRSQLS